MHIETAKIQFQGKNHWDKNWWILSSFTLACFVWSGEARHRLKVSCSKTGSFAQLTGEEFGTDVQRGSNADAANNWLPTSSREVGVEVWSGTRTGAPTDYKAATPNLFTPSDTEILHQSYCKLGILFRLSRIFFSMLYPRLNSFVCFFPIYFYAPRLGWVLSFLTALLRAPPKQWAYTVFAIF